MLIKTTLISAVAAIGLTGAAAADGVKGPSLLTDETMDTIIAGSTISSWGHLYYAKKDPTEVGVEDLYQKLKKGLDSTSPVKSADDEPAVSFYDPISDSCDVEGCVDIGRDDAASFFALKYSP